MLMVLPGGAKGAQPAIVVPAGRVIEEIQVDDQAVRVSTKICTLRGVQRIATAAVALSPGRAVSERQEDPTWRTGRATTHRLSQ
jgi:hypothetical protein